MEYSKVLDLSCELGYELAMAGAETFRVEESITRVLQAYGIEAEVFVIPNCMHVSIEPVVGRPLTRMRRIGIHGNDLDAVERFSGLSRRICAQHPAPEIAQEWLAETKNSRRHYSFPIFLAANFLTAFGFSMLFGGTLADGLCSGVCGLLVGLVTRFMERLRTNQFFQTMVAAFPMALLAYAMGAMGLAHNPDSVIIGGLMLLVPGLLITNAMRDIIYGDTNSGINRLVQVLLIAGAIILGAFAAWNVAALLWGAPASGAAVSYALPGQLVQCFIASLGFALLFNIHGKGTLLCVLGGECTWVVFALSLSCFGSDILAYFFGAVFAAIYSEAMARIRKYPATSYLVVSIISLIPGAGVYYTMNHAVHGDMDLFASQGLHTAAIAGVMAVGILVVSTVVRLITVWRNKRKAGGPL